MEEDILELSDLIYSIARKFTSDETLIKDLYQEAVIGIINAKKNYDENSSAKFSSYARMYIYGEIYKYFNENNAVKKNKDILKMYKLVQKTRELLAQELRREPSTNDIARYLKIDEYIIVSTLNMMKSSLSLDYSYDDDTFSDYIGVKDVFTNIEIRELLSSLNKEEQELIYHRYIEGYSQSETARIMNMSQSSVSRCEKESLGKMRIRTI